MDPGDRCLTSDIAELRDVGDLGDVVVYELTAPSAATQTLLHTVCSWIATRN